MRDDGVLERALAYTLVLSPPLAFIVALWLSIHRLERFRHIRGDRWTLMVMALLGLLGSLSALRAPVAASSVLGIASVGLLFWFWAIGRFIIEGPVRFARDLQTGIAILAAAALLVAWGKASYTLALGPVSLRVLGPENKGTVLGLGGNGLGPLLVFGGVAALGRAFESQPLTARLAALAMAMAMLAAPVALGVRNAVWGGFVGAVLLVPTAGLTTVAVALVAVAMVLMAEPALLQRLMRLADLASEKERWGAWYAALAMIRDHPVLGVGPNHFASTHPAYALPESAHLRDPHNVYLRVASEWGVPAAVALTSWLLSWPVRIWPLRHEQTWRWPLIAAFGSFLAMSVFDTPIFTFHISAPVMVGLGLACSGLPGAGDREGTRKS